MIDVFKGINPVDPVIDGQIGSVKIAITPNSDIQISNYGTKSFTVENTGDKRIAAIYFDVTDALFPDTVFDPVGLAGDSAFRSLTFFSTGGTGAFEPKSDDKLVPFYGVGGVDGYEGMLLTFNTNIDQGYDTGEIIQFGVDMDPNSIVGLPKKLIDIDGNDPRLNSWDMGGVSGAELINSKVYVLFTDGTTAVGELMGDGSQGGSVAVASQTSPDQQVTLTVNGIEAGGSGSYSQANIQVLISGQADDTARVVLAKGFIQPFNYIDPNGNPVNLSEKFIGSPFPANNAIEFQTVDVLLDGNVQDITSLFTFGSPSGNLTFPGNNQLPIGFTASIIDTDQLPTGPITEPIYLVHNNNSTLNTAPTSGGITSVEVTEGASNTVISLFDIFEDAQDLDTALTYEVIANSNESLFETAPTINPTTGELSLIYAATEIGTSEITVRATDTEGLFIDETFSVTIIDEPTLPSGSVIRIEAEDYLRGTNGVEYFDKSAGNTGGAPAFAGDVDVEVTQDEDEGFNVSYIQKGEFLNYSVDVPAAGVYDLVIRAATNRSSPRQIEVIIGGQTYAVNVPPTGGWQSWQDVVVSGVSLNAGVQNLRVNMLSSGLNLNYFELRSQGSSSNTAPTTSGIADVTVTTETDNTVINLFNAFADAETSDAELTYEITGNTNPALFDALSIDTDLGTLTLDYAAANIGSSNITVRGTDSEGLLVETTFTVSVKAVLPPLEGVVRIEAEDYLRGTNGVEYFDKSAGNTGGAPAFAGDVDVEVTQDEGEGFNISYIQKGEFLNYSVDVPAAGVYDLVIRAATNRSSPRQIEVIIGGQTYAVNVPPTGGWQSWQDVVVSRVSLNAGVQNLRVNMLSSGLNLNYFELRSQTDLTPPTASLVIAEQMNVDVNSTNGVQFVVTYADNIAIDADSLDASDVRVTNSSGQHVTVSLASINSAGSGTSLQATYEIVAPVEGWQLTDRGDYTVEVLANAVFDTSNEPNAVPAQLLGSFNLNAIDPLANPSTIGIPDIVIAQGTDGTLVDLDAAFEDFHDPDSALTYTVLSNSNSGLATATVSGGNLVLSTLVAETGTADIVMRATDTDGFSVDANFTLTVASPLPDDNIIRINAGGGNVLDTEGNRWLSDTYFAEGIAFTKGNTVPIDNTKFDSIYQTQRQGSNFSYSIPVANGNYNINFHLSELEFADFEERFFDVVVENQLIFDDFDVYGEIKNAFLEGENTAKVIQGPDKTTINVTVNDGLLDLEFTSVLNDAIISGLEIVPVSGAKVLIDETEDTTQITEAGSSDTYAVVLNSQPVADVIIDITTNNQEQIALGTNQLVFTPNNWGVPQSVSVSAVDDNNTDGTVLVDISHTASSADLSYSGLEVPTIQATVYDNDLPPVSFVQTTISDINITGEKPTVGAWGPDGRLYFGTLDGEIRAVTFDGDYNVVDTQVITTLSGLYNKDILGIAFNPFENGPGQPPKIYVAHSKLYYNPSKTFNPATDFIPYSGQVSVLEGPDFDVLTPLVTGLGVSNHDHGVNGLAFNADGDLLIAVGGNTNAGIPSPEMGYLEESALVGAILKAEITRPNFNGMVEYEPLPQFVSSIPSEKQLGFDPLTSQGYGGYMKVKDGIDVSVYASGLRNSFGIEWSTKGVLYGTENGPNQNFGNVSTGPDTDEPFTLKVPDEILRIQPGDYFGHPNRNRGLTDSRENYYYTPDAPGIEGVYTAPIATTKSSTTGITEYRSTAFDGQLYKNLFAQKWKQQVYNISLNPDGTQATQVENLYGVADGLDILTGPGGAVFGIDYSADTITIATPDPLLNPSEATAWDIHPWRAPAGSEFIIGGVNFDPNNTTVTIAEQSVIITGVSDNRIRGILPDLSNVSPTELVNILGPDGLADVVVQSGDQSSTIPDAFRPLLV